MSFIKKILVAFICVIALSEAFANGGSYVDCNPVLGQCGYYAYVRGSLLYTQTEFITLTPFDRFHLGAQLDLGFIKNITPTFGLGAEISAGYYGRVEGILNIVMVPESFTYYGFQVAGVGVYRVTPRFWVRARLGLAMIYGQPDAGGGALGGAGDENRTNTNPLIGFGLMYAVSPNLSLTGDYTFINGVGYIQAAGGGSSVTAISMPQFNIFQFGIEYRWV